MRKINQIISDFIGLIRVCGFLIAIKWGIFIFIKLPACIKENNLQPVDKSLGVGPFKVKRKNVSAYLTGVQVISGIREIWVRDVYLKNDFLNIPDKGLIVDLGAIKGNFLVLALAHSLFNKVISFEPNKILNKYFCKQINLNGFSERTTLKRSFIGNKWAIKEMLLSLPEYEGADFITQVDFIRQNNITQIDFLKCDIEGSEFELLQNTALLVITSQLAIEIHDLAGDRNYFLNQLIKLGFILAQLNKIQTYALH